MPRKDTLLERVWQQVGQNRLHQRWISPYVEKKCQVSVEGLAASDGVITVSPLPLVPTIIHEALHRAHPEWSERAVEQGTSYLYNRMSDDECRRLYEAYAAKVQIKRTPVESE